MPLLGGVQFVMREERGVKAPQAGKAAHQRDLRDRQLRVRQQLPGCVQSACLQVLHGRHAKLRFKNAAQMPVADAQLLRKP